MADLEIIIGENKVEVTDPVQVPIAIDYQLEDQEDFQSKTSGQAIAVTIPATLMNAAAANSFENPSVEDLSEGQAFRNPQKLVVRAKGSEIMLGKALLQDASHTDRPEEYTFNFYGDNADWVIDMADLKLFDVMSPVKIPYTKQAMIDSWQFDGTSEALPYVFAPARYAAPMGVPDQSGLYDDYNCLPTYLMPSISKFFIIYWAFKKYGYRISSGFMNLPFFRRQVMPWTFGGVNAGGSRLDNLRFLAKSDNPTFLHVNYDGYLDLNPSNDSKNGAYDNNNSYSYDPVNEEMIWTYLPQFNYGNLDAHVEMQLFVDAAAETDGENTVWVEWYKISSAGRQLISTDQVYHLENFALMQKRVNDIISMTKLVNVNPGDQIIAKIKVHNHKAIVGAASVQLQVLEYSLDYFRIPIGGSFDLVNYASLKNYSFLDFLRGVVDEFNLSFKTDVATKTILIEPTHPYVLPGESVIRPGFFNMDFVDWSEKLDLSQKGVFTSFASYNRIVGFSYRQDGSDTLQKIVQDRYAISVGAAKYVLPERFQNGPSTFENRFFSCVMHYDVQQWGKITGTTPQMISLVSESSSNISAKGDAQSILTPKSAYYKGLVNGMGWVFDGVEQQTFPFMFGVNYMPGGENDPVLSYSDEHIGNDQAGYQTGQGLLKRFFLQRMANIRNGQWHDAFFRITDYDVALPWHREFKTYLGQRWELITISGYKPLTEGSTKCTLRKWTPISQVDDDSIYPSAQSLTGGTLQGINDVKYNPLKGLWSDIPK